ncbi:MAG TPA: ABC transporter permease [Vicinamibacterales bacterium]|nr:ABC transporter permease [Vicinamibacterales bacterium]
MGRTRALTSVLLLSLALGTGANAAVCGAVYALLVRGPAGVESQQTLVSIFTTEFGGAPYGRSSYADFRDIAALPIWRAAAAIDDTGTENVRLGDAVRRVRLARVTGGFFPMLGITPHAGRLPAASDEGADAPAAVVSYALAETLASARSIVGERVTIGSATFTVAGVAPRGFRGLHVSRPVDAWIPFDEQAAAADRGDRRLLVVARRGGEMPSVQPHLAALSLRLASAYPSTNRGTRLDPEAPRTFTGRRFSTRGPDAGPGGTLIGILAVGAVALLLVSACINAGTLLLARAMARRREVAIKLALGATRRRLVHQRLAESLVVWLAGAALGLLLAAWITAALPAFFAPDHAELLDTRLNPVLIALTVGVAGLAGVLFGLAPAIHGTRVPPTLALRADSGGVSDAQGGGPLRGLLLAGQLALSTLLLMTTALLMQSAANALAGDFGFGTRDVAVLTVRQASGRCAGAETLERTLGRPPGVEAVGWAAIPPLGRPNTRQYRLQAGAHMSDHMELHVNVVTPGYFDAMQVRLVEGRYLEPQDRPRTPRVAVVDELLAQRRFGGQAIGQYLLGADGDRIRIVGVVGSGRYRTLQEEPQPTVYLPLLQDYVACGHLFVRTSGPPAALLPTLEAPFRANPRLAVARSVTLEQHLSDALALDRVATSLMALCGVLALVMGAIGVYGAMSDAVVRRTREIGLRVALGAGRRRILRLVGGEAAGLTAAGVAAGTAAALIVERFLLSMDRGLPRLEAAVLLQTPAVLVAVVALAAVVPLWRALAVAPTEALRAD